MAARFPGGVRLLDLAGTAPDTTAPDTTAPHTTAPDTTAPVTTGTDDADTRRRVEAAMAAGPSGRSLVLVDHAEPVLDVVAEVLDEALTRERHGPPTARPAVLAVSREPLGVTGERLSWLSPLPVRPGNPGARPAAAVLLADRLARVVPEQHLDEERWGVVEQVAAALDGLPLALELAAARARSYTLEEILVQVRADAASLAPVGRGPHRPRHSLHEAVDAGVRLLDPRCRALHAVLAVVSGPFPAELAAALLDAPRGEVAQLLGQLVHCSLLSVLRSGDGARDSSFVQLTAVRAHAARALDPAVAAQARARRDAWLADPRAAHGTHTDARPRSEGRA
ncbi:hypothetical protein [Actinomycetospora cinnamomea]|uniref:hypothetical protein n=1 Tax=Actinomycetospora cinnamomea TaxID=663609 RepID=UPI001403B627|nr:hypothetical protein [Actinomycetospora cinnamomea]